MENLTILDASGATVLTRSLADEPGPLLAVADGKGIRLAASVAAGERLIAALVRNEDGWTLAAADPKEPVSCGAKSVGSLPLLAGAACSVAGFVFRVESDAALSGNVLVWRVGKSAPSAESVHDGHNVVAEDALRGGALTVNPAVPGAVAFEFYPHDDALDVVMPSGVRLSVESGLVFRVGPFTGLMLPAAEAAAAVKSGRPFAYPSRGVRRRLMAAALGVGLVFLAGAFLSREAARAERLAEEPRGAVQVAGGPDSEAAAADDDSFVFMLAFYRSLPLVLGAEHSPVADDLVARADGIDADAEARRAARFLKDVAAIQDLVAARRWADLDKALKGIDAEMFTLANATRFLEDVKEISDCANRLLPEATLKMCAASADERKKIDEDVAKMFNEMSDNIFVLSPVLDSWFAGVREKRRALIAYLAVRDRALAPDAVRTAADVESLRESYARLVQALGDTMPRTAARVREELAGFAERELTSLVAKFGEAADFTPAMSAIVPLCELAADAGVAPEKVRAWRQEARRIDRLVNERYRVCYQSYRLTAADDPAAARRLLDEMLAIGQTSNKFYAWARRERARLDAEDKEVSK